MDYKIKDINQAEFGRKEISIAESEMPGLMALGHGTKKNVLYLEQILLDVFT